MKKNIVAFVGVSLITLGFSAPLFADRGIVRNAARNIYQENREERQAGRNAERQRQRDEQQYWNDREAREDEQSFEEEQAEEERAYDSAVREREHQRQLELIRRQAEADASQRAQAARPAQPAQTAQPAVAPASAVSALMLPANQSFRAGFNGKVALLNSDLLERRMAQIPAAGVQQLTPVSPDQLSQIVATPLLAVSNRSQVAQAISTFWPAFVQNFGVSFENAATSSPAAPSFYKVSMRIDHVEDQIRRVGVSFNANDVFQVVGNVASNPALKLVQMVVSSSDPAGLISIEDLQSLSSNNAELNLLNNWATTGDANNTSVCNQVRSAGQSLPTYAGHFYIIDKEAIEPILQGMEKPALRQLLGIQ